MALNKEQKEFLIQFIRSEAMPEELLELGDLSKTSQKRLLFEEFLYPQIEEFQTGRSRWTVEMIRIFKVGERYFSWQWDNPATEMQEGGDTNDVFNEVVPHQIITTKYGLKNENNHKIWIY